MDESLQHFLQRPENRALAEAHQRKEVQQSIRQREKASALEFRSKVLNANLETQQAIAPLLKNKVLRRVIQTFTNDEDGNMDRWACNAEVLRLLHEAKRQMDEGYATEEEMEALLVAHLQGDAEFQSKSGLASQRVVLGMEDLVSALNEHLTERRQGNQRYQCKDFEAARKHYEGAKSIVDMIQGSGATEQQEIDNNRVTILLNLAALHLATKENRKAVQCCSEALQLEPNSKKALLRRGKANMRMHNYKAALADMESLRVNELWDMECEEFRKNLQQAKKANGRNDVELFSKMLA